MANNWPPLPDFFAGLMRGTLGLKLGPGVLSTISPIAVAGFIALAAVAWALSGNALLAGGAILIVGAILVFLVERILRYAERNPIPALMGGAELLKLIEHQMGAKDETIVTNEPPVIGAQTKGIDDGGS